MNTNIQINVPQELDIEAAEKSTRELALKFVATAKEHFGVTSDKDSYDGQQGFIMFMAAKWFAEAIAGQ